MHPTRSIMTLPQFSKSTREQANVIVNPAKSLIVVASAGSGKTTTMMGYAAARPNARGLYMAFSKQVEIEANARLKALGVATIAKTQHSLAWPSFGGPLNAAGKLPGGAGGMTTALTAQALNLGGANRGMGSAVNQTLVNYMSSTDEKISAKHLPDVKQYPRVNKQADQIIHGAKQMWAKMTNPADPTLATPDVYLKQWCMNNPRLDYDFILFDECQDANPLTVDLVNKQLHTTRVYVGDPYQAIFGFRGAIDMMGKLEAEEQLHLTNSFRFGHNIGKLATTFLKHWRGCPYEIVGAGRAPAAKGDELTAYLARTVSGLMELGFTLQKKNHRLHWIGRNGFQDYRVKTIMEAYAIKTGDREVRITDSTLKLMRSWDDFGEYAKGPGSGEAGAVYRAVEKHGDAIPQMLDALDRNQVRGNTIEEAERNGATAVMATAHRSKGLEFPVVRQAHDFPTLKKDDVWLEPKDISAEELHLYYVMMTRAERGLVMAPELRRWFSEQPGTRDFVPPPVDKATRGQARETESIAMPMARAA